jgi:hypothetical protein
MGCPLSPVPTQGKVEKGGPNPAIFQFPPLQMGEEEEIAGKFGLNLS